ncbi:Cupredoxin [Niveomyces insectorum RCEF 264]|uniref:Cupredoxin n=1 Tax=Niveomyces insectorum RCEF 264 TaxID=1081102 RepID=A0A167YM82_9HYPO|nr:Cupredoxin [Niveomyces insectorum RCEF 264]
MKYSAALSLGLAPVVLAKAVHNVYPVRRDPSNAHNKQEARDVLGGFSASSLISSSSSDVVAADEALLAEAGVVLGSLNEIVVIWVNGGGGVPTTTVNAVQTVTQTVTAGQPETIAANVGDMVIFTFLSQNHTVTQSAFTTPCELLAGGMDSGFQPNANNSVNPPPQVALQVMVDTPLWFYCRQAGHCGKGMTFSINPTANKTQAMFQELAIAQNGTGAGSAITGNGGGSTDGGAAAGTPPSGSTGSTGSTGSDTSASGSSVGTGSEESPLTATLGGGSVSATGTAGSVGGSTGGNGVVTGLGTVNSDGSCSCAVQCASGSFPAVQAQGLGAFGGMPGSLPTGAVAIR